MNETKITKAQLLQDALFDILENDDVLRDKQREAFSKMAEKELIEISDGYFRLPTAFGKTVMFSLLAKAFSDKSQKKSKVIILVPRLTLVWQTLDKLQQFADKTGGVYIGSEKDTSADIIVSTYQSADRLFTELQANKQDIGLIIADEAHHALGEQKAKTMRAIAENTPVVGFTATPTFSEDRALGDLLSTELYTLSIEDCVKDGLLCPVKNVLYRPSINYDIFDAPIKSGRVADYDYVEMGKKIKIQTLIDEISQLYGTYGDGDRKFRQMRAIINCPTVEIADKQAEKLNELYGRDIAVSVHSDQRDFKKRVDAFLGKKYRVVCQVNTLTEGLDDPSVELCINYPSHSPVKIEQTGGRVLRQDGDNPNKFAYVLDTIFRATPEEPLETSLCRAFVAGQVLYRDVAGEFVVKPEDQVKQQTTPSKESQSRPTTKFDVVTDETLLKRLNPRYKEWREDNQWLASGYIPLVDELHDMSPEYLSKRMFDPTTLKRLKPTEILAKMKWLRETSMPDAIHLRRSVNNRRCLYLIDEFYPEFVENSGYQEIAVKTKRDIDIDKLSELYVINKQQAKLRIIQMAQQINAIYKIDERTGRLVLCFDKKYLKHVAAGLKLRPKVVKEKPKSKEKATVATKKSGFKPQRKGIAFWKSEQTLMKYLDTNIKPEEMHMILENFAERYPSSIKLASDYKSFLFNIAYVPDLCEYADLMPLPIPLKTDEWKNAEELKSEYHINAPVKEITLALKKFSSHKTWMSNNVSVLMNPATDLLDLCVNTKTVDEFIKFSGLPSKNIADAIRQGTKKVETLTEIGSIENTIKGPGGRDSK